MLLLVEDNPMDLDLTLRAFRRRDQETDIQIARDGEEAVAWMTKWEAGAPRAAVILLDLKLPKLDGLEALRLFKAHREFRTIPVVVLTTSAEDRDVRTAYQLGANSYIVKPVAFERFVDIAAHVALYWTVLNRAAP